MKEECRGQKLGIVKEKERSPDNKVVAIKYETQR